MFLLVPGSNLALALQETQLMSIAACIFIPLFSGNRDPRSNVFGLFRSYSCLCLASSASCWYGRMLILHHTPVQNTSEFRSKVSCRLSLVLSFVTCKKRILPVQQYTHHPFLSGCEEWEPSEVSFLWFVLPMYLSVPRKKRFE